LDERNLKPSAIPEIEVKIEQVYKNLLDLGLSEDMIITLIQREAKINSRMMIKRILGALVKIEKIIDKNQQERDKINE